MTTKTMTQSVNIAPSSESGHYVEKAKKVINLDEVTESYFIEGESQLTTKNHQTLEMKDDCLINCQVVYNPFAKMYQRSRD